MTALPAPAQDFDPSSIGSKHLIVVVDDDNLILASLNQILGQIPDFMVVMVSSGREALNVLERCEEQEAYPAVVIADYMMPEMNGVQLLEQVKRRWPNIQRILLTAVADRFVLEEAINRGEIYRVLTKPWNRSTLLATLWNACAQNEILAENARRVASTEELIRNNARLGDLADHLEKVVSKRTDQLMYAKRAWEMTFDAISDPVILLSDDYTVLRANHALAQHAQQEVTDLRGKRCHKLLAQSDTICEGCPVDEARRTQKATYSSISLAPRDTIFSVSAFPFDADVSAGIDSEMDARFVCVYRDITAQEQLHRKLITAEKMTAMGVISGAVAHEINNPLGGILAFAQIMKREVAKDDEKYEFLVQIEDSAIRCQKTVRNLLDFARFSPREERQRTDLGTIIEKSVALVRHSLNLNNITVSVMERNPGAMTAPVVVNSNQVQTVFVNLMRNAADAMERDGTITIKVNLSTLTSPHYVIIRVIDTGTGIAEKHLGKVFDPFFTTKQEGKGTGLGLALSHQIVQENAGKIEAHSELGQGATFVITFPVAESPSEDSR